ncbi:hypothetical protein VWZ88_04885 [Phaeobacter sp. JH20_36]|uniref:hypothetical protein n=1 Tax=unclassified Phaeobacter TaxID=2621772 RepID=UPI003A8450CD
MITSSNSALRSPQTGKTRNTANIAAVSSVATGQARSGGAASSTAKPGTHGNHVAKPKVRGLGTGMSPIAKLGAAAAVLALFAVGLAVLQFGSDDVTEPAAAKPRVAQLLTPQALAGLDPTATSAERAAAEELLTAAVETAAPLSAEDALVAQMTAGTLAALRRGSQTATAAQPAAPAPAASQAHTALYSMVLRAVGQGQSPAYIDQMVNDAYRSQSITVPAALIGADGRVDTATILALFVGQ